MDDNTNRNQELINEIKEINELKMKIKDLTEKNDEDNKKIIDLENKNKEANDKIEELIQKNNDMKNQLSFINSQELQKNNNINIINNESENNIDETTSLMDDKANKSNLLINDYNYLKSKYSEAENLINKSQ